jgi:hypothetical protein
MSTPTSPPSPPSPPLALCPECGGICFPANPAPALGVRRLGSLFGGFSAMRAVVCGRCGLTRFYAVSPAQVAPRPASRRARPQGTPAVASGQRAAAARIAAGTSRRRSS